MSAIAPVVADRYLECNIRDADLKIEFNPDVIQKIGAAVMEGYKLVPRRGLEVGGLLLGRVDGANVIVEEFQAIDSEHKRGPSWLLSDKDRQFLAEGVSRANAAERATRVVGLYRSQTRAGFAPAEDDVALIKEHAGRVFLLVKPEAIGLSSALCATGDGLQAKSETFPFRARTAAASAAPAAAAPRAVPPLSVPRLQAARVIEGFAADQKLPPRPAFARRLVGRRALTAMLLLGGAASGYLLAKWSADLPPREAQIPAALALHASWNGRSLDLDWNRDAPQIRRANGAVLWIEDGDKRRRLDLGLDDLTQGSIEYWPASSDVAFRLDVFTPGATASESVRAVSVPLPPPAPPAEPRRRGSASRAAR